MTAGGDVAPALAKYARMGSRKPNPAKRGLLAYGSGDEGCGSGNDDGFASGQLPTVSLSVLYV
jgi:hypothetical protein